jgi:hypothetical protein
MQKRLTSAVATALAERVRTKLRDLVKGIDQIIKKEIESSKEYKKYISLVEKRKNLDKEMQLLSESICKKYDNKLIKIGFNYNYTNSYACSIHVRENTPNVSLEAIRNSILIEDYMSSSNETAEELVERIAKQFFKS